MAANFINHLIDLVIKEREEEKLQTNKLLEGDPFELEEKGVAILNLQVIEEIVANKVSGKIQVCFAPTMVDIYPPVIPKHKLTVGDLVEIKEDFLTGSSDFALSGIISKTDRRYIRVDIQALRNPNGYYTSDEFFPNSMRSLCHIVKLPNDITYKRMLEALTNLRNNYQMGSALHSVLLDRSRPSFNNSIQLNFEIFNSELNDSQVTAVAHALYSSELHLIHGPPGTGKTEALIEIIRQLVENMSMKVLVCGPSNVAVDNLLGRVMKHDIIETVRVGNMARISPKVIPRTLDVLAFGEDSDEITKKIQDEIELLSVKLRSLDYSESKEINSTERHIQRLVGKISRNSVDDILKKADVVFCTLNAAGSVPMLSKQFDVVIIDEAAQATEPDCWIALSKGKKLIMAGDHLQLPPTIKSLIEVNTNNGNGMSTISNLSYTLFDRLICMYGDSITTMLSIQYRMHEKIMQFSSDELYDGRLIAHSSVEKHVLSDLLNVEHYLDTSLPIIFIDTTDSKTFNEEKDGKRTEEKSTSNDLEVLIVFSHIRRLLACGVAQDQIGVITPYSAQVAKLYEKFGDIWKNITIGSVDGFQGKEKEVIIISMVRSNKRGEVGFLADRRRLNVAMTRAKRSLVIVGDTQTLSGQGNFSTSLVDRSFLTKWIDWLDGESEKRVSSDYVTYVS